MRNKVQRKSLVRLSKAECKVIWGGVTYYPKEGRMIGKVRLLVEIAFELSSIAT